MVREYDNPNMIKPEVIEGIKTHLKSIVTYQVHESNGTNESGLSELLNIKTTKGKNVSVKLYTQQKIWTTYSRLFHPSTILPRHESRQRFKITKLNELTCDFRSLTNRHRRDERTLNDSNVGALQRIEDNNFS